MESRAAGDGESKSTGLGALSSSVAGGWLPACQRSWLGPGHCLLWLESPSSLALGLSVARGGAIGSLPSGVCGRLQGMMAQGPSRPPWQPAGQGQTSHLPRIPGRPPFPSPGAISGSETELNSLREGFTERPCLKEKSLRRYQWASSFSSLFNGV